MEVGDIADYSLLCGRGSQLVIAAAAFVLTAGCGAGASLKPGVVSSPIVSVTMTGSGFLYRRPVPAGRVVFVVRNVDQVKHELQLVPLPEDMPPVQEQLHGSQRRELAPVAGVPGRAPGQRGVFAVDLIPGARYGLVDTLLDADGQPFALKGMASEFRTTAVAQK